MTGMLSACVNPNDHAMELGAPPDIPGNTTVSLRAMQSRTYDTLETERIVSAAVATLQDLGFTIDEVSEDVGVLIGSKERDAVESGQVAAQFVLVVLMALAGSSHNPTYDESQTIQVSLVVNEISNSASEVRIFFDRHLTNNQGVHWRSELIVEPEIYQQFFEKLSASAFFEENAL